MKTDGDALLLWLHSFREVSEALEILSTSNSPFWVVGGAARDYQLANRSGPSDLDIAVAAGSQAIDRALGCFPQRTNRYGNRRYWLPGGCVVDVIEPTRFYGAGDSVAAMLSRFDVSVNAVGVEYPTGRVLDPIGGWSDARERVARLPVARWEGAEGFEAAHLLARAARCIGRFGLDLLDQKIFASHLGALSGVDWLELERLNGQSRQAIEALIASVLTEASCSVGGPTSLAYAASV